MFRSLFQSIPERFLRLQESGRAAMSRALSVDAGYDRWKRNDTEKRSREPSGTFPRIQRMMDSDQRTETEKEKGNGGERERAEGASVEFSRSVVFVL